MSQNNLHYLLMLGFNRSNHAITSQTGKWELLPGQPKFWNSFWNTMDAHKKKSAGDAHWINPQ